jgi:Domain of unknown function (DUF397)
MTASGNLNWRTSSRSSDGENCVEVAYQPDTVAVRDSKNPNGPVLAFSPDALHRFLTGAKAGQFDH